MHKTLRTKKRPERKPWPFIIVLIGRSGFKQQFRSELPDIVSRYEVTTKVDEEDSSTLIKVTIPKHREALKFWNLLAKKSIDGLTHFERAFWPDYMNMRGVKCTVRVGNVVLEQEDMTHNLPAICASPAGIMGTLPKKKWRKRK